MTNEAKLTKTQIATLAEVRRINASDEPAVEFGIQRKGINGNALRALRTKGLLRAIRIEGFGTFAVEA